jgi:hypothetical protein
VIILVDIRSIAKSHGGFSVNHEYLLGIIMGNRNTIIKNITLSSLIKRLRIASCHEGRVINRSSNDAEDNGLSAVKGVFTCGLR